jgi:hypothetical protein
MKFLHVTLSLLMLLTSAQGLSAGLMDVAAGPADTAQHAGGTGHDCCDEPAAPADQDCCDSPTCGQCSGTVLALNVAPGSRPPCHAAAVPLMDASRVPKLTATPPFRPPIA